MKPTLLGLLSAALIALALSSCAGSGDFSSSQNAFRSSGGAGGSS